MSSLLSYPKGVKPPKRAHENGRAADQQSLTQLGVVRGGPTVPCEVGVVRGCPPVPRDIVDGSGCASYASVLVAITRPCVSFSTDAISLCSADSDDMAVASYFASRQLENNKKKQRCER